MAQLESLLEQPTIVNIIHYACEDIYNPSAENSPRISVIAIRKFESGQTETFSVHHEAELQHINKSGITQILDTLEKEMLSKFYNYVKTCENHKWLHWNMRDTTYGFNAIANRYSVLGGAPISIPVVQLFDLARILIDIYGENYAVHPRMENTFALNGLKNRDFLTGEQEAEAFANGEYGKISKSTQRKTGGFDSIVKNVRSNALETESGWLEQYDWWLRAQIHIEKVYVHWLFKLLVIASVLYSACGIAASVVAVLGG